MDVNWDSATRDSLSLVPTKVFDDGEAIEVLALVLLTERTNIECSAISLLGDRDIESVLAIDKDLLNRLRNRIDLILN